MAEADLLQAILQIVLVPAVTALIDELQLLKDYKKELKSLTKEVSLLQAYLRDAAQKQRHEVVRLCLNDLQEVAYDANDLLDDCAFEAQRQKVIPLAKIRNFFSPLNPNRSLFLHGISGRVSEMKVKIEASKKQLKSYGLRPDFESPLITSNESSSLEPPLVLGREDDEKKMRDLLMKSGAAGESNSSVVCVVGIGGIGKTVLAQRIYNDELVSQDFKLRAWVHVSHEFKEDELTKAILESIDGLPQAPVRLDILQKKLISKLRGRKYLLVLDDVWTVQRSGWQKFRIPLLQGATGSKILVTTRSVEVAETVFPSTIYRLQPLSDEDCWSLFHHYMVQQNPNITDNDLRSFSVDIAQKCHGLPSAAEDSALRLCQEPDRRKWKLTLQNEIVGLTGEHSESSRAGLSYQRLPAQLKPCFAFCSMFPNGFEFEKEELVKLWMAQNFIKPSHDQRTEDVGNRYFEFLERRLLFQHSPFDRSKYIIHSSIHDFIRYTSKGNCAIAKPGQGVGKVRHLYLNCQEKATDRTRDFLSDQLKSLYTLVIFGYYKLPDDFTKKLENLRALDLSNTGLQILPNSIGNLTHLRCLQLRSTEIRRLPGELSCLYLLQTLGLQNCYMLEKLPKGLNYLQNLRHIDLHWDDDSLMTTHDEHISRLSDRRHGLRYMPPKIGLLINLQTLSRFVVGKKSGRGLGELNNLNHLHGELLISNLDLVKHEADARGANLIDKQHLQCLELHWADVRKEKLSFAKSFHKSETANSILCALQPHGNLKVLRVFGYIGTYFPTWLGPHYLHNLTALILVNCRRCFSLPPLGNLPFLTKLHIEGMDAMYELSCAFCGQGKVPFRALKRLHFENMTNLKRWLGDKNCVLRSLRELIIRRCLMLEKITHSMPSLEKLVIEEAPKLAKDQRHLLCKD